MAKRPFLLIGIGLLLLAFVAVRLVPRGGHPAPGSPATPGIAAVPGGSLGAQPGPAAAQPQASPLSGNPARTIAGILEGVDLSAPGERERVASEIRDLEQAQKRAGLARAKDLGLPARVEGPDGTVREIAGVDENGQPIYFVTHNANAAISTGANLLQASPYALDGAGLSLGLWDAGSARSTHQEFGARVSVVDGAASADHSTHVAGTMIAAGIVASAKGMAPAASLLSYDWNSDKSEMSAAAAVLATDTNKVLVSNHSYGIISGWAYSGTGTPVRTWEWNGSGTNAASSDPDFGLYNTYARDSDSIAYSAPYYLIFRSAGNDRSENPSSGQAVALSPGSTNVVAYDATLHPPGDGSYRGGFDNIGYDAVAKNVITVGSVGDAVTSGARDVSKASMASYSSWGPTDDGRIKPDVVANGEALYSSLNSGNAAYGTYSGTSMASPDASGSAALVARQYIDLFGSAMRASTLKALLIHTADDLGNAGPDYKYGWGLVNAKAAADVVRDHKTYPLKARLTEGQITTATNTASCQFYWDGVSPIRATLAWTDPAGTALATADSRAARLVNNLDLKVTDPDGAQHLPFVMPFVGTWTQASMDLPAVTGTNSTDNVEQVLIAAPPKAGVYRATVSFQGTLSSGAQKFSLVISGSANQAVPPPPLALTSVSPASALSGTAASLTLAGASLGTATAVKLSRAGSPDISATNLALSGESLTCQVNLAGATAGTWNVVASSASESATLTNAFTVIGAIWSENFDGAANGWTATSSSGTNSWALTNAASQTSPNAYFARDIATRSTVLLTSPAIAVPSGATSLQLSFWHNFSLQSRYDGGRLEISVDGGAWFSPEDASSGCSFGSNGYNNTIRSTAQSDFAGKQAWTGSSGGFVETVLNLTDNAKFAGKALRFRWSLATDSRTSGTGWYVDSVALLAGGDLSNQAPVIASGPTVDSAETQTDPDGTTFYVVRGGAVGVSVSASDDGGEASLTYSWSAQVPAGSPVLFFSPNTSNAAKAATAYFEVAGDYACTVSVQDAQGLSSSGLVHIRVLQTATRIGIAPDAASVTFGEGQVFSATLLDQFDDSVVPQPAGYVWSCSGGGTVDSSGAFTSAAAGGPFTVTAAAAGISGAASVVVNKAVASVVLGGLSQTYDGNPKPATATTAPGGLSVVLAYGGTATVPSAVGTYPVEANVVDPNYQGSATGTLTISLSPFDAWRAQNFGPGWETDPQAAGGTDNDRDGASNLAEFYLGTDPNSYSSCLATRVLSVDPATGQVVLEVSPAVAAGTYSIQTSSSPFGGWGEERPLVLTGGTAAVDSQLGLPGTHFRILYHPPDQ